MSKNLKTYQYRLYLSQEVKQILTWISNERRLLFNYFLKQYRKEDKWVSKLPHREQAKEWNKLRDKQVKELVQIKEQKSQLYQVQAQVLQDLPYREIPAFWKSFLHKRTEYKKLKKRIAYPRYKTVKDWHDRIIYPQQQIGQSWVFKVEKGQLIIKQGSTVKQTERVLKINIRLHTQKKNGQKKPRPLPFDIIKTLTISWKNDKYFAGLACEVEPKLLPKTDKKAGIDMGLTTFIATSDSKLYDEERKYYLKAEKRIIKAQKNRDKKQHRKDKKNNWVGSKSWERACQIYQKRWESFKNQRKHETYQVVNDLLQNYSVIVRENLKIKNLVRKTQSCRRPNHCLAKRIHNAGWGITFNLLKYMAESAGREVVKVSPHNTSQMCSECDELREPKLKLGQKIFNCFKCGLELNRDINAARNILKRYLRTEGRGTSLAGAVSMDAAKNLNSQPRSPHPQILIK